MEYIRIQPLYKEKNSQSTELQKVIEIAIEPVTCITPSLLLKYNPDLELNKLYGFNANILCGSKATIIIRDFVYFTLSSFENGETILSHLKIYNTKDFFRLNRIKIGRIDIENSNSLLVDCDIGQAYIGIENHHRRLENDKPKESLKNTADIRGSSIDKLCNYNELSNLNVQDSIIRRLEVQENIENILIWQYSQIENCLLSKIINSLKIKDSKVNVIRGTSELVIKQFQSCYSTISSAYNIFENNIYGSNEEVYNIIRMSYFVQKNYEKYAMFSYLISDAHFKNEKKIMTKIPLAFLKLSCGFGYRLSSAVIFSFIIIMLFSICYFSLTYFGQGNLGLKLSEDIVSVSDKFFYSIYHSIITFATLGYGDTLGIDWSTRFLSGIESLIGIYSMSIIVYTLTKKYSNF